jgi:hypothetical protein
MKPASKSIQLQNWRTLANGAWLTAYLLVVAGVVGGLIAARSAALANFQTPEAQTQWTEFRTQMQRQAQDPDRSVSRRPPLGDEPPTLRLLRDHFPQIMVISLVLVTALFGTLMVMIRGVIGGRGFTPRPDRPHDKPI